jgi:uncharacterized protein
MKNRFELSKKQVNAFCKKWKIKELALFGSALRDDFESDSDVDLLVSFTSSANWSLLDHVRMEIELEKIIGRKVDIVTRRSVENSRNPIRRKSILESAKVVYATR